MTRRKVQEKEKKSRKEEKEEETENENEGVWQSTLRGERELRMKVGKSW